MPDARDLQRLARGARGATGRDGRGVLGAERGRVAVAGHEERRGEPGGEEPGPVSYTHLTLPTSDLV